jgi:multicomponent Na+:H+ antiporter subunit D
MEDLIPLFVAIPLAASFLTLLLKSFAPRAATAIAVLGSVALLLLALCPVASGTTGTYMAGGWDAEAVEGGRYVLGIAMVMDGLARLFLLMIAAVSLAVVLYSLRYLERDGGRPLFFGLFHLLVAGMCGAVLAGDLFNLFVFLEIASISSYALVAYGTGAREVEAAFKYLILGAVASTAILVGIGVLYATTGFLNMAHLYVAIRAGAVPDAALLFAGALFLTGFGLKAALMPFHAWLPDAHPSAPAPISAMLSGLLIKSLGVYAIIRVFYTVIGVDERIQVLFLTLGCISMLAGVLLALGQDDLKRLLAYSSISQMGFVFVALGCNTWLGVAAALFHVVNHSLFKSALFLNSGSLERITGTRKLSAMGGVAGKAPATALATVGASLAIGGVPPLNGFWSKLLILIALFQAGLYGIAFLAAGTAVLTLVTFIKVQRKAIFGPLPAGLEGAREVSPVMYLPVLALVLLCVFAGLLWPTGDDTLIGSAAAAAKSAADQLPASAEYVRMVLGR